MEIKIEKNMIVVTREPKDKKIYGIINAKGESQLLYRIKVALQEIGLDCIKKRMAKDGNLVDDMQQYIRARNGEWCAFNNHWAINGLEEDFNNGTAVLTVSGNMPECFLNTYSV